MKQDFVCVSKDKWVLTRRIYGARRYRLLQGTSFKEIVQCIVRKAKLKDYKRSKLQRNGANSAIAYRVEIILKIDSKTIDLFHNSRCGYRAQFYKSVPTGKRANRCLIQKIMPRLKSLLKKPKRTCPWDWTKKSLLHRDAKVWIHQGSWIRLRRKKDRNICVKRWMKNRSCPFNNKKILYGMLSPQNEILIDLKGGYIDLQGKPSGQNPKINRDQDIHRFGFT